MDKLDFPDNSSPFLHPGAYSHIKPEAKRTQVNASSLKRSQKSRFSGILADANRNSAVEMDSIPDLPLSEEAVKELLDAVHSTGDNLKNRPLPEEIMRYKKAVRNFLHYVVQNGYTTEKQFIGVNLKRRKEKTLIQVADRKLEQLAAGILAGQSTQLEILARLEEITGLLIDLTQ